MNIVSNPIIHVEANFAPCGGNNSFSENIDMKKPAKNVKSITNIAQDAIQLKKNYPKIMKFEEKEVDNISFEQFVDVATMVLANENYEKKKVVMDTEQIPPFNIDIVAISQNSSNNSNIPILPHLKNKYSNPIPKDSNHKHTTQISCLPSVKIVSTNSSVEKNARTVNKLIPKAEKNLNEVKKKVDVSSKAVTLCKIEECNKRVRSRGLCKKHGGGVRCKAEGCEKSSQGGGYCIRHHGGRRCSESECSNSAQSNGKCKRHGGGQRCKFKGCEKSSQGSGYCFGHGGGYRCRELSCDRRAGKNGYCNQHRNNGCLSLDTLDGDSKSRSFFNPKAQPFLVQWNHPPPPFMYYNYNEA